MIYCPIINHYIVHMKKVLFFIAIIIGISCTVNYTQNNSGSETDLEILNLYGKVKEIKRYSANYLYSEKSTIGKSTIEEKKEFTRKGFIKQTIQYDLLEKPRQINSFEYDTANFITKTTYNELTTNQKTIFSFKKDTVLNTSVGQYSVNDTVKSIFIQKYDGFDNVIKETKIKEGDTIITQYEYQYNKNNKVVKITELKEGYVPKVIGKYKYNSNEKLIEAITRDGSLEFKVITNYNGEKLVDQSTYITALNLPEDSIDGFTTYDQYYNPIQHKSYEDSKLHTTYTYTYSYDNTGNWIKRITSEKKHFAGSNEFVPTQVLTREISYW